jgi:hypothetical protein
MRHPRFKVSKAAEIALARSLHGGGGNAWNNGSGLLVATGAEEIRTEADNFGSEASRETMEMAARSWEQLARLARNGDQQQRFFR